MSISIDRRVYTLKDISDTDKHSEEKPCCWQCIKWSRKKCQCSSPCCAAFLFYIFPFINTLRQYQWKQWILGDLIAGLSVGIMHIPQGLGFALLTNVPPVYGLYSSFFPVLFHYFFAGSRHTSFGTMALISIMVGAVVDREVSAIATGVNVTEAVSANASSEGTFSMSPEDKEFDVRIGTALAVSFMVGLAQIIMSVCRLGIITSFFADSFIGGFTTGAAFQIATSQLKALLGLKFKAHVGYFKLPKNIIEVFKNITSVNLAALITSVICIAIILLVRKCINERYRSKLKLPIPIDFIVVVVALLVSHFADLNKLFGLQIIGEIPLGIPAPTVLPVQHMKTRFIGDAIVTGIISFVISIAMAKLFAKKYSYTVDSNQEMLAYGVANGASAFFHCFAGAVAPPRVVLRDVSGGKTQLASVFSCGLLLIVLLAIGQYLTALPNSALSSIIVASLLPLFMQFTQLPSMWRTDKFDLLIWLTTWAAATFVDIDMGLYVGVGVSLITLVIRSQLASASQLGNLPESELYGGVNSQFQKVMGVVVFRFEAPLSFANCDVFKKKLSKVVEKASDLSTEENTQVIQNGQSQNGHQIHIGNDVLVSAISRGNSTNVLIDTKDPLPVDIAGKLVDSSPSPRCIVVDCSSIPYVDSMGCNTLKQVTVDYQKQGFSCVLAACTGCVLKALQKSGVDKDIGESSIYLTVHDAVMVHGHMSLSRRASSTSTYL